MTRLGSGGLIDRSQQLRFTFDGKSYAGHAGDTLASALVANDVKLVGRSFKYHRPRGILTAGAEEPNALVELGTGTRREPNTRATTVELFDGLVASSQNRWPTLALDLLSLNQLLSPFFVGGFYYKTFMWPASFWEKVYEPLIRRAAGLGRASGLPDPDAYEKATAFCDVLVIGSGPAGLMAARTAARAGARVILCEDDFRLGGRLLAERVEVEGRPGAEFARSVEDELAAMPEVRIFRRTQVFGTYDGGTYGALERVADHLLAPPPGVPRQRLWHIVARRCVNAMGAVERPIAFADNDRPGVMLAAAVRTYVNRFAALPARRAVVFTTTDDGWRTAQDLIAAGAEVSAVVDPRREVPDSIMAPLARSGARLLRAAKVTRAIGGSSGVKAVEVAQGGSLLRIEADGLAVSGGWNPQVGLTTHKGSRARWSPELSTFVPGSLPEGMRVAGAVSGDYGLSACLRAGHDAGSAAAQDCGFAAASPDVPRAEDEPIAVAPLWHVTGGRGKSFVDQQNDVTVKDVEIAWREGFRAVEHLKRYTTLGMATDQGKTSNVVGHAIMAELTGRPMEDVGTTVTRPPHLPVAIGAFAGRHRGRHFKPTRYVSGHDWALRHGATMVDAGQWLRPQWFSAPGETDWLTSVIREVKTTRLAVGVCDVSTLGKIDIKGKDAGVFLDRVYINRFSTLPVGKARYGIMLREDGFVMDDGTTARLGPMHYVMSTTTANAGKVMQHLEFYHQVVWPELDIAMVSVTEHWAQYAVAGPRSREVIQAIYGTAADVSNGSFPYLACREIMLGEIPTRLFRLSFSGEMAFEIAIPARYGESLLGELLREAVGRGGCAYGTEALGVMRVEKGHVAGNELNGQTVVRDLGLGRMASSEKDYVGRIMAGRPALVASDRPTLVGVQPVDSKQRLRAGAHVLALGAATTAENDVGYVTSVVYSPTVGSWIGLALVKGGTAQVGTRMRAYDPVRNGDIEVNLVSPIFVDPKGERLHG
ncbi:MAG: sarcosine oxidase subunit alpha family protein [Bradyrhizobium sp.]|uniref:sarcosine oxidase subunit alpha family protein n=1 Tax=Bradyrhizobium sp. TaxID=376 RepID=UPI0025B8E15D|nr:sarcosine oxidase subunit alpha family protein [Bradyrhizobium sp.]MBI5263355.1 sarcosine oxidase subunit alpha family protein [Bradyrhizobium sp.]